MIRETCFERAMPKWSVTELGGDQSDTGGLAAWTPQDQARVPLVLRKDTLP